MKKTLLSLASVAFCMALSAQTHPSITLKTAVDGKPLTLGLATSKDVASINIDWGDGTLVPTEAIKMDDGYQTTTNVTGTAVGTGEVKIYSDDITVLDCSYRKDEAKISELNVSNLPALRYLYAPTHELTAIDLSKNTELYLLELSNNLLENIDLTANVKLHNLTLSNNRLTAVDLSKNTELYKIYLSDNAIPTVDFSANNKLKTVYMLNCGLSSVKFGENNTAGLLISMNNNALTSFDGSNLTGLESLSLNNNLLTELKLSDAFVASTAKRKTLNIMGNSFTLATLPVPGTFATATRFNYAPQRAMEVQKDFRQGDVLDLSAQTQIKGLADAPQATVFAVSNAKDEELVAGVDYSEEGGKITFLKGQTDSLHVSMTTPAFPKFVGTKVMRTTNFYVTATTNGVTAAENAGPAVSVEQGELRVSGLAEGETVLVYSLAGETVATRLAVGGKATVQLGHGVYVVKAGGKAVKVVM